MKNILFLLFAISTFAFTGCSDDKTDVNTNLELKVGETYNLPAGTQIELASDAFVAETSKTAIKANHAGQTTATIKLDGDLREIKIKVLPNNTLYDNDYLLGLMMKDLTAITAFFGEPISNVDQLYTFAPLPEFDGAKAVSIQFHDGVAQAIRLTYPANYITKITKHVEDRYYNTKQQNLTYMVFINGLTSATWTYELFVQNAAGEASVLYMTRKFAEDTIKK